jgi:hypothetical protein
MTRICIARHGGTLLVAAAVLVGTSWGLGVAPALAGHDTACKALPTSGTRATTVTCNPRQECINKIPGNVQGPARTAAVTACNANPTSGQCPSSRTYNPQQECLNALPQPPKITISRVEGGDAGGDKIYAGRGDVLYVRGTNVGMPGNTVTKQDQQVWQLDIVPRSDCPAPDCVALAVQTGDIGGAWRFVLKAGHGHSEVTGYFTSVLGAPSPDKQAKTPIGKLGEKIAGKVAEAKPRADLYFIYAQHDLWGEKVKVQIGNKGQGASPLALVYMYLYKIEEVTLPSGQKRTQRTAMTNAHKDIIPLCPNPGPCPAWFDTEFHVPVTSFAKEIDLIIDPGGFVDDSNPGNNTHKISVPGTQR